SAPALTANLAGAPLPSATSAATRCKTVTCWCCLVVATCCELATSSRAASVKRSASMTRGYALSVVMSSYLITDTLASRHTEECRHGTRARTPRIPWRPRRPAVKLLGLELSSQCSHHCLGVAEDHAGVGLV